MCLCVSARGTVAPLTKTKQSVTFQSSSSHTAKNTDTAEPLSSPRPSPTSWCRSAAAFSQGSFAGPVRPLCLPMGFEQVESSEPYFITARVLDLRETEPLGGRQEDEDVALALNVKCF